MLLTHATEAADSLARRGRTVRAARRRRNHLRWLSLFALGALLAACAAPQQQVTRRYVPQDRAQQQQQRETTDPSNTDPSQLGGGAPAKVALLLPLSGEHEFIGRALQQAAEMAVFEVGNRNFSLLPLDTRGTAAGAQAAVNQAISQGAQLILGPLFSHSVEAVRGPSAAAGIQVIAFSTDPAVAGGNVYLLSFLPRPQVSRILGYAGEQGMTRVGVLAPDNAYGRTVVRYAQETSVASNVEITRISFYPAQGDGINEAVREFAGVVSMSRSESDTAPRAVRRESLNFDAVLVPDGGQRLRSIASLLAFYDVNPNRIRFLGTGLWDSQTVLQEQHLHGGWFAGPPPYARERFVTKYRQAYQQDPPRIASLSYDAVALAALLARRDGLEGQKFSPVEITNPSGFLGIDGIFRFGPDGLSQRGVAVMEVTPEEFRLISPAPTTFEPGIN